MKSAYDQLQSLVAIAPDGRMLRVQIHVDDLGPRDDLLLKAAGEAAGVPIHHFCDIPGPTGPMPLHMYAAATPALAVRLPIIRFNTFWAPAVNGDEAIMVPTFSPPGAVNLTLEWNPPADCPIYMVARGGLFYMIALYINEKTGGFVAHRLLLPNIFDDAKICMGTFKAGEGGSAVSRIVEAIDHFAQSQWNVHLLEGDKLSQAQQLIRFTPDGKTIAPSHHWSKYSKTVSGSGYNWLVAMAQAKGRAP